MINALLPAIFIITGVILVPQVFRGLDQSPWMIPSNTHHPEDHIDFRFQSTLPESLALTATETEALQQANKQLATAWQTLEAKRSSLTKASNNPPLLQFTIKASPEHGLSIRERYFSELENLLGTKRAYLYWDAVSRRLYESTGDFGQATRRITISRQSKGGDWEWNEHYKNDSKATYQSHVHHTLPEYLTHLIGLHS